MKIIVTGTFPEPSKLASLLSYEIKMVHEMREEGFVIDSFRRTDRNGVFLIVEALSVAHARDRLRELPFAKAGLIDLEFTEIESF